MPVVNNINHKKDRLLIKKIIEFAKAMYPENNIRSYLNGICEGLIIGGRIKKYITVPDYNNNPGFSFGELQIWFNNGVKEVFK